MSNHVPSNETGDPDDERWVADLSDRYQRLFREHSCMQTQHAALKKAMLQEQSEKKALVDSVREKEKGLHVASQELDLLKFHNERLTKRVEMLQESLSQKGRGSWLIGNLSKKTEPGPANSDFSVMKTELQARTEENERLHNEIFEANNLYRQHMSELQQQIADLRQSKQHLQAELKSSKRILDELMAGTEREKAALAKALDEAKQDLNRTRSSFQSETEAVEQGLFSAKEELDRAKMTINENVDRLQGCERLLAELREEQIVIAQLSAELIGDVQASFGKLVPLLIADKERSGGAAESSKENAPAYLAFLQSVNWHATFSDLGEVVRELRRRHDDFVSCLKRDRSQLAERLAALAERAQAADAVAETEGDVAGDFLRNAEQERAFEMREPRIGASEETKDPEVPGAIAASPAPGGAPDEVLQLNIANADISEQPLSISYSSSEGFCESTCPAAPDGAMTSGTCSGQQKPVARKAERSREALIKRHYETKLRQLYEKIQLADSRAVRFYRAWQLATGHVLSAKKEKDECRTQLGTVKVRGTRFPILRGGVRAVYRLWEVSRSEWGCASSPGRRCAACARA